MQVLQPTVVDSSAFQVWKDEAFELWTSVWGSIYPSSSASRRVRSRPSSTVSKAATPRKNGRCASRTSRSTTRK